jgi:hypothetical protein
VNHPFGFSLLNPGILLFDKQQKGLQKSQKMDNFRFFTNATTYLPCGLQKPF